MFTMLTSINAMLHRELCSHAIKIQKPNKIAKTKALKQNLNIYQLWELDETTDTTPMSLHWTQDAAYLAPLSKADKNLPISTSKLTTTCCIVFNHVFKLTAVSLWSHLGVRPDRQKPIKLQLIFFFFFWLFIFNKEDTVYLLVCFKMCW